MAIVDRAGVFYAYIADVSGHGLQSGLLMSMLVSSLRTAMSDAPLLAAVLERVNAVLPEVKEAAMYATFGGVRLGAGSAEGILAGHPPLLHYRPVHRDVVEAGEPQLPLGLFKNATYSAFNLVIEPGDMLLLITDGLLDVTNAEGEDFGADRIKTSAHRHGRSIAGADRRRNVQSGESVWATVRRSDVAAAEIGTGIGAAASLRATLRLRRVP